MENAAPVKQVQITFDPDLSEERCISVSKAFLEKEPKGVAQTLVKDYTVEWMLAGKVVASHAVKDNHQRRNVVEHETAVDADAVRLSFQKTNGCPDVHVYEIRIY